MGAANRCWLPCLIRDSVGNVGVAVSRVWVCLILLLWVGTDPEVIALLMYAL